MFISCEISCDLWVGHCNLLLSCSHCPSEFGLLVSCDAFSLFAAKSKHIHLVKINVNMKWDIHMNLAII